MNNVLILGDGKLAHEIYKQTNWDYISRKKDNIDFVYTNTYIKYVTDDKYDIILNCIANTKTEDNRREAHWDVNYVGVINLVDICDRHNKKLVHISSDYLYSGSKSYASEIDVPVHVNNWYCYTKLLADGYVQAASYNYLLIRTSFKLRPYPWDQAWIDMITNADYVDVIANKIINLIEIDAYGVYNVGTEIKTFYDLAKETEIDVKPSLDDYHYNRPHDVTMNLDKMNNKLNKRL